MIANFITNKTNEKRNLTMSEQNQELQVIDTPKKEISLHEELTQSSGAMFSSIPDDGTRKSKATLYNAISNPDHSLSDCIGQVIDVVHVVAHEVELESEQTGELENHVRVVLIDKDNKSYATVSSGVMGSLKRIFAVVGQAPYIEDPLSVVVVEKKGRKGYKFLSLEMKL